MKKKTCIAGIIGLIVFTIFTILVCTVDRQAIGIEVNGEKSLVGFASLNQAYFNSTPVNFNLYKITDWGSIPAIVIGIIFFIIGFYQLVKRKNVFKVDFNILCLGVLYIVLYL